MSDPFVGEIRMFAGNFAPTGWALCNGQLLPISQNTALFSLLGTYYGGDGKTTFALPNLQGAAPLQQGQGSGLSLYDLGQTGGEQAVTLLQSEIPSHTHSVLANDGNGNQDSPLGNAWASAHSGRPQINMYSNNPGSGLLVMSPQAFSIAGASQPHNNMPPYLVLTFIIALQGIFPPRS
jgi:microcystin-dependent protein